MPKARVEGGEIHYDVSGKGECLVFDSRREARARPRRRAFDLEDATGRIQPAVMSFLLD